MIALIESGAYSDYRVEVVEIDEPWQAWAYVYLQNHLYKYADQSEVALVVAGSVLYGEAGPWDCAIESADTDAWPLGLGGVDIITVKVEAYSGSGTWIQHSLPAHSVQELARRARAHIEEECAAGGKPVPWEGLR
jgi:hypothetical protein